MFDCRQFRGVAGAVLEGESHPEASAHLLACARCRQLVDDLAAIQRAARTLPRFQPRSQLWHQLEAAARREGLWSRPSRWEALRDTWSWLPARPAFAAVLVLTLLLGGGLTLYPGLEFSMAEIPGFDAEQVARGELVREASYAARYQIHLQQVQQQILDESAPEDAQLRHRIAGALTTVDRCIERTRQRLEEYPEDTLARAELHRLYRQKASVLQTMTDPIWLAASGY
ncbi:MAG: hypothetical protein ACE5G6_07875 [Terriglobia bacterium]